MVKDYEISMKKSSAAFRLFPFTTLSDKEDWKEVNMSATQQRDVGKRGPILFP
jgi:hypothetical protein